MTSGYQGSIIGHCVQNFGAIFFFIVLFLLPSFSNRIGQPTCRPAPKTSPTTTSHQAQSRTHCRPRHLTLPSQVVISSTAPSANRLPQMALARGQVYRCVRHFMAGGFTRCYGRYCLFAFTITKLTGNLHYCEHRRNNEMTRSTCCLPLIN